MDSVVREVISLPQNVCSTIARFLSPPKQDQFVEEVWVRYSEQSPLHALACSQILQSPLHIRTREDVGRYCKTFMNPSVCIAITQLEVSHFLLNEEAMSLANFLANSNALRTLLLHGNLHILSENNWTLITLALTFILPVDWISFANIGTYYKVRNLSIAFKCVDSEPLHCNWIELNTDPKWISSVFPALRSLKVECDCGNARPCCYTGAVIGNCKRLKRAECILGPNLDAPIWLEKLDRLSPLFDIAVVRFPEMEFVLRNGVLHTICSSYATSVVVEGNEGEDPVYSNENGLMCLKAESFDVFGISSDEELTLEDPLILLIPLLENAVHLRKVSLLSFPITRCTLEHLLCGLRDCLIDLSVSINWQRVEADQFLSVLMLDISRDSPALRRLHICTKPTDHTWDEGDVAIETDWTGRFAWREARLRMAWDHLENKDGGGALVVHIRTGEVLDWDTLRELMIELTQRV